MTTGGIAAADIISVLTPIWQEIPETGRQVRNRICAVLDYSHAKGWRSTEAPSGNSSPKAGRGLPRQVKKPANRKATPYVAVLSFLNALRRKPSYSRLALDLLILTGFRSQEGAARQTGRIRSRPAPLDNPNRRHEAQQDTHGVALKCGSSGACEGGRIPDGGSHTGFARHDRQGDVHNMTLPKVLRYMQ